MSKRTIILKESELKSIIYEAVQKELLLHSKQLDEGKHVVSFIFENEIVTDEFTYEKEQETVVIDEDVESDKEEDKKSNTVIYIIISLVLAVGIVGFIIVKKHE